LKFQSAQFQRDIREVLLQKDLARQDILLKRLAATRKGITAIYKKLEEDIDSDEGKALLAKTIELRKFAGKTHDTVIDLVKNGKQDEATELLISDAAFAGIQVHRDAIAALVEYEKAEAQKATVQGEKDGINAQLLMSIGGLLTLVVLIAIALMVIRAISGAITEIVTGVTQVVASMSFKTRLPTRADELNGISNNLNTMFIAMDQAISEAHDVVASLAAGNMTQRVTGNYSGDLVVLKNGVNDSADSITTIMETLSHTMSSLSEGKFDLAINEQASGEYGVMLSHAANAMNTLNHIIADINLVMSEMNVGDFNARINADARGALLAMKDNINNSMDNIAKTVTAMSQVILAQADGDLTQKLPDDEFKGQLHDLKNAINYSSAKVKDVVVQTADSANIVSETASPAFPDASDLSVCALTPREIECLTWASLGKTATEMAYIMTRSESTVVFHTENAKKKLEAKTLPHAVAKALNLGLIGH
jgi:methyl-accepting chemotaxis protein